MNHELLRIADQATAALDPDTTTREQLLEAMEFVKALKEATGVLAERVEAGAIAWIDAHGEIECNGVRYYVGPNKTTKCLDLGKTFEAVLTATGGDTEGFMRCLSTGAFKHGACREVLPAEVYAGLFKVTETGELKEGKPSKRLQRADDKFLPNRSHAAAGAFPAGKDAKEATDGSFSQTAGAP